MEQDHNKKKHRIKTFLIIWSLLIVPTFVIGCLPVGLLVFEAGSIAKRASNDTEAKTELQRIQLALEDYYTEHTSYPSSLDVLVSSDKIDSIYINGEKVKYETTGQAYELSITLLNGSEYVISPEY